ncbi:MAG: type I CRISPR-associated protein Cas7, partial [Bryobacteraceae bacterium]
AYVPYGLYRLHGFYSPSLGVRRNAKGDTERVVKENDLAEFWEALNEMFAYDRSASRGEMRPRGLYVFTHENSKGNAPAHKLFELIKVSPLDSERVRAFDEYSSNISVPEAGPLKERFQGVTLSHLIHDAGANSNGAGPNVQ